MNFVMYDDVACMPTNCMVSCRANCSLIPTKTDYTSCGNVRVTLDNTAQYLHTVQIINNPSCMSLHTLDRRPSL